MNPVSLGVGLTNQCNLDCPHCFRPRGRVANLTPAAVARCLQVFDVAEVRLGGMGEEYLSHHLTETLDMLHAQGVPTTLTTNGQTLMSLDDRRLNRLARVEISIDFADAESMNDLRGDWVYETAIFALQRAAGIDAEVTVAAVMMKRNWDRLAPIAELAAEHGAGFRLTVCQPIGGGEARFPTSEQFWDGLALLLDDNKITACTEPIVVAASAGPDAPPQRELMRECGRSSLWLTPFGEILPCVYWKESGLHIADVEDAESVFASEAFERCRQVPAECRDCPIVHHCRGGCAARRQLTDGLDKPDPYCPRRDEGVMAAVANAVNVKERSPAGGLCRTVLAR